MGHQSRIRQKRKQEIIHRKVLFGGVETAMEVHARLGWRGRCHCGGAPVVQIRTFMLLEDAIKASPEYVGMIMMTNPDGSMQVPVQKTKFGDMIRVASVLACRHHQKELEIAAARGPSNALVEIDRGPGAERPVVAVGDLRHISESVSGARSE